MEAAGLAVGIVGLVALLDTTLGMIEKAKTFATYDKDHVRFQAQFAAHKLTLEAWRNKVGLTLGGVTDRHSKAFDDEHTLSVAEDLLRIAMDELDSLDQTKPETHRGLMRTGSGTTKGRGDARSRFKSRTLEDTKARIGREIAKAGWALGGKDDMAAKEAILDKVVEDLQKLVPPVEEMLQESGRMTEEILEKQNRESFIFT